jgi:hypothetical protein
MTENSSINSKKTSIPDFEYLNFNAEKESWNRYKLEDGSILKSKLVMINIIAKKGTEEKIKKAKTEKVNVNLELSLQPSNVIGVEASPESIGEPSTVICSPDALKESVVAADMDFETISEVWNQYLVGFPKIDDVVCLKIRNSLTRISRTSKFDKFGIPIYLVDFTTEMKVSINPRK